MHTDPFPDGSGKTPEEPLGADGAREQKRSDGGARDRNYPGHEVLGLGSSRAILARLVDGDPFEIGPRCVERMREEAFLVSLQRVHLRAVARTAYAAVHYRGTPPLAQWLRERIDESVREILAEDREAERDGSVVAEAPEPLHAHVAAALGVEASLGRRACNAFNRLPAPVRHAFFAVVIERKSVNRYVAEGNGPPSQVNAYLREASEAIEAATRWHEPGQQGWRQDE